MTEANKILSLVNETKASYRRGGLEGNLLNVCSFLSSIRSYLFFVLIMTLWVQLSIGSLFVCCFTI